MPKIVALVPLRDGSKSIPKKNIKPIAGKPLCAWVLEAAVESEVFDQIYVSTDSTEIANVVSALDLGVEVLMRPAELATDTASTEAVMLHLMEQVNFDILCTIQATSPLVRAQDFKAALEKFDAEKLDSLLTGVRLKRFFWNTDGTALNYDPLNRPMRQQFEGTIMENGVFYFTHRKVLEQHQSRLGDKIGIYEMAEETVVELDEPEDWPEVERLLRKRNERALFKRLKNIKLLAMDCDGVLTDAGMYYSESGEELKKFNTRDGQGLALLREKGIKTAIITGEDSQAVKKRAEKLKIDDVYLGVSNKRLVMQKLIDKYQLINENIAYIGDDLNDLSVIELPGIFIAVKDAVEEVKKSASLVLTKKGGSGAVREVCDIILEK